MVPVLEDIANRMETEIKVAKIDTEKYPRLGSKYQIEALPTLVLFKDGKEIDRYVGYMNADQVEASVRKVSFLIVVFFQYILSLVSLKK